MPIDDPVMAERFAQRIATHSSQAERVESWGRELAPPVGSIGHTGSDRERSADVVEVSVVSVLHARGPE